jgi:hypothetical protein
MLFCFPGRDDPSRLVIDVGIDHGERTTLGETNGVPARLRVVETIVDPLQRWPVENLDGVLEGDSMDPNVFRPFVAIPRVSRGSYLHNVRTEFSTCRAGKPLISWQETKNTCLLLLRVVSTFPSCAMLPSSIQTIADDRESIRVVFAGR